MRALQTLVFLCLVFVFTPLVAQTRITVVTEDIPPLNYLVGGRIEGISTEIVRAVLKRADIVGDIQVYPWARAIQMAESQANVLIYSIGRLRDREKRFKWIGPMYLFTESLYKLSSRRDITLEVLEDAKRYKVGVVHGYAVHELLKGKGFEDGLNLEPIASQEQNIRKLFANRIDLLVGSKVDVTWRINRDPTLGSLNDFEEALVLKDSFTELYMAFGLKTDDEIVHRVRGAFEQIRAEGVIEKILKKYNYSYPVR